MAWADGEKMDLTHPWAPLTVDDLFLMILRAQTTGAERLDVTYDEELSYPKDTVIDEGRTTSDDDSR
jgi:hypothetical protein